RIRRHERCNHHEVSLVMTQQPQSANIHKTSISPMLSVRNGPKAVEFYKAAFGADELFRIGDEKSVVAQLSVGGAEFWLADESPEHLNFSPESVGGGTVRMVMVVDDPDAAFARVVNGDAGDAGSHFSKSARSWAPSFTFVRRKSLNEYTA